MPLLLIAGGVFLLGGGVAAFGVGDAIEKTADSGVKLAGVAALSVGTYMAAKRAKLI